jgi:3-oxoacyl-[acyl-carrier-protein] synthase-3
MSSTLHSHSATDASPLNHQAQMQFSGRSPLATLTGAEILSTGFYAPEIIVRNEDLSELGYDAEWIVQRTGIRERRRAGAEMATSDVACRAANECLASAKISASELDLILVATMTPDMATPSTACLLQQKLGAKAPAMDINAACAGFMYALVTGMHFVAAGTAKRVLVVGADLMSRTVNPADQKTFPLFGDGAGAVILGPAGESQGLLAYTLGADGSGGDLLCLPGGGSREPLTPETLASGRQYLEMDGRAVFKWAVRVIQDAALDVIRAAELTLDEISLVVLHQANIRIIDAAVEALGIERERVFINLDRFGNTSAASIPLALAEAHAAGRIKRGDNILMAGFGAGLAWGAGILRW